MITDVNYPRYLFFEIILLTSFQRASHPVIGAPRRLLQFAVRDAVRTVQPVTPRSESASKRLRSVVSTLASDSTLDITHIRLQRTNSDGRIPGATAALRAAAEATEDAIKGSFSGSVFNRLGRMPTINHTETLRDQDPEGEEYENKDNIRAENQVEFYERNQYSGSDAYMHDQESEEATGSAPNIDEYDRYNEWIGFSPKYIPFYWWQRVISIRVCKGSCGSKKQKIDNSGHTCWFRTKTI